MRKLLAHVLLALTLLAPSIVYAEGIKVSGQASTINKNLKLKGLLDIDDGDDNIGIGTNACDSITAASGLRNICIGQNAGTALTTGDDNVIIGFEAGEALTTQKDNTIIGMQAGQDLIDSSNVIIGKKAATNATNALQNVIIGSLAVNFGVLTGNENVFIGYLVANKATSALDNVLIGTNAAGVNTFTGGRNVFIGKDAGRVVTSADENVLIGNDAGIALTTGDNNVFLGEGAGATLTTESNRLVVAVTTTTTPLIQGYFATGGLEFHTGGSTPSLIARGVSDTDITYLGFRDANGTLWYMYPTTTGGLRLTIAEP